MLTSACIVNLLVAIIFASSTFAADNDSDFWPGETDEPASDTKARPVTSDPAKVAPTNSNPELKKSAAPTITKAPSMVSILAHIKSDQFAQALDELGSLPQTELTHYYTGLCYMRLNRRDEALREFAWIYYYGRDPKIHQNVLENIRELDKLKSASQLSQETMIKRIAEFKSTSTGKDDSPMEFFMVVRVYFSKWDLNRDSILTGDEIATALQNPGIKGKEAVALAALKTQERFDYRNQGQFSSFTMSELAGLQAGYTAANKEARDLVSFYNSGISKLASQADQLFTSDVPHINGIKQGHTSDCYFLSVVGALIYKNPEALKQMITKNADGTFQVSFYGSNPIRVNAPTQAELATYADSGGDGFWLTVLEKAYGVMKSSTDTQQAERTEPLDEVAIHGGKMGPVIYALTGRNDKYYKFSNPKNRQIVRSVLAEAKASKRLVSANVPGHCLALIQFQQESDSVLIWNPWGVTKYYDEVGVMMNNGFFTLPVDSFLSKFQGMSVEQ